MHRLKRSMDLFGGKVELVFYDTDESIIYTLFPDIEEEALRLQKIFNLYDKESELSVINSEKKGTMSDELATVVKYALDYCKLSNGLYDVSKGKQFLARKEGKDVAISCSYSDINISGNHIELSHPDVMLDLGSVAKGFIADKIIEFCKNLGFMSLFIDARGDLRMIGDHVEIVDIQNPRDEGTVMTLMLNNTAIATSGDYKQYHGSYDFNHIVSSKIASATSIAPTLMEADLIATLLMISESSDYDTFLKGCPALTINKEGNISVYNDIKNRMI